MNGFAIILLGFIAFGVLHVKSTKFMPWQWYVFGHFPSVPAPGFARTTLTDTAQAYDHYGHHHADRLRAFLVRPARTVYA